MVLIIIPFVMFIGYLLGYLYATEVSLNQLREKRRVFK
jgi:hypothetical protein